MTKALGSLQERVSNFPFYANSHTDESYINISWRESIQEQFILQWLRVLWLRMQNEPDTKVPPR